MPQAITSIARERYLRKTYGITSLQYDKLLESHDGRCWICNRLPKKRRLHVEHDHRTGRIRGLADFRCNLLLQHAHDDSAILRRAAEYLESREADAVLGRGTDAQV